jgi:carbonic anhydrase
MEVDSSHKLVLAAILEMVPDDKGMPFMDAILAGLPRIQKSGTNTTIGAIDISPVTDVIASCQNYAYVGSLTQPPCTEGVAWVVAVQTFPITVRQYNGLTKVLGFNGRYTQNKLGDGNLLQIAKGNDTDPAETAQQIAAAGGS